MGFRSGGEETPLNVIRLYKMEVPINKASDMSGSSYLSIGYLLRNERGGLQI